MPQMRFDTLINNPKPVCLKYHPPVGCTLFPLCFDTYRVAAACVSTCGPCEHQGRVAQPMDHAGSTLSRSKGMGQDKPSLFFSLSGKSWQGAATVSRTLRTSKTGSPMCWFRVCIKS